MAGFLVKVKNSGGKVLAKLTELVTDRPGIYMCLVYMEKEGKANCTVNKGGYPFTYTAKACDIIPLLEKWFAGLPEWDSRRNETIWMTDPGAAPETVPYSSGETLEIEFWDLT